MFMLRPYYVNTVLTTPLLRYYCILIQPRPHNVIFDHMQPRPARP